LEDAKAAGVPGDVSIEGGGAGRARGERGGGGARLRSKGEDHPGVAGGVPQGWCGCAGAEAFRGAETQTEGDYGGEARGGTRDERGAPRVRDAAGAGRVIAFRGARGERARGAADSWRSGAARGGAGGSRTRASTAAFRACEAESALAVGHFHVSAAAAGAAVPDDIHGRPLALRGVACFGAPPAGGFGGGGSDARNRGVRDAGGGADRPGAAVHGVARRDRIRAGAAAARDSAHQEQAAASADGGQGGAILEDAMGRVFVEDRLLGFLGLSEEARAFHRRLQLPKAASGAGRFGACRSLFPGRDARAERGRASGRGQRATASAGADAA
jgi:hypothetical protein